MVVVIVGGGIMGVSTAYFLAKRGISSTIIDQTGLSCAASGRAGGFLAKDWCSHYEFDVLARKGFELHMQFAQKFPAAADYRCVDTYSVAVGPGKRKDSSCSALSWVDGNVQGTSKIGSTSTTAQVHPQKLVGELFRQAQELTQNATTLKIASVVGLNFTEDAVKKVTGVRVAGSSEPIPADVVLLATGPWSGKAVSWLPPGCLPVKGFSGQRAHGVIVKPQEPVSATCLFMDYTDREGSCSPEVYPRPDGTVYICGLSDSKPVPDTSSEVDIDEWRCIKLAKVVGESASSLKNAEIVGQQACYLPLSPDGLPVIGRVPAVQGVYIATGHSCWGILTGPITGRFMAAILSADFPESTHGVPSDEAEAEAEEKEGRALMSNSELHAFDPARLSASASTGVSIRTGKRP